VQILQGGPKQYATVRNHYYYQIVLKTASATTFLINFEYKMATRCYMFLLNIQCVTSSVTSSAAVFDASTWVNQCMWQNY